MSKCTKFNHVNVKEELVAKRVCANDYILQKPNERLRLEELFDDKIEWIDHKARALEKLSDDMKKTLQEVIHLRNDVQLRQRQTTTTSKKKDAIKLADLVDVDLKGIKDGDTLVYKNKKFVCQKKSDTTD